LRLGIHDGMDVGLKMNTVVYKKEFGLVWLECKWLTNHYKSNLNHLELVVGKGKVAHKPRRPT